MSCLNRFLWRRPFSVALPNFHGHTFVLINVVFIWIKFFQMIDLKIVQQLVVEKSHQFLFHDLSISKLKFYQAPDLPLCKSNFFSERANFQSLKRLFSSARNQLDFWMVKIHIHRLLLTSPSIFLPMFS